MIYRKVELLLDTNKIKHDMKVRASLKKRTPECKIVRRKGRLYVINKKILSINNVKDNLLFLQNNLSK